MEDGVLHRQRAAIYDELARLEESARDSAQGQFEATKQWRTTNLALGIPSASLAAVAGATALATTTGRLAAGILALASAALGAVLTTLNASHRMTQAAAAANAYLEVQTAARQARLVDLETADLEAARATLAELTARHDEQNKTAEVISARAYRRAQRNIAAGGQRYAIDGPRADVEHTEQRGQAHQDSTADPLDPPSPSRR